METKTATTAFTEMSHVKLTISSKDEDVVNKYNKHTHFHEGDAGIDLFANESYSIEYGEKVVVDFGIQCEMKEYSSNRVGTNVGYFLYPRSSISKTPLIMLNSVGVIDAGYRGNIMMVVRHVSPNDECYHIKKGDRIAQLVAPSMFPIKLVATTEPLDKTSRGTGGFGSTGK